MGELTMFDYKHYVPILRWKAAEKEALGFLTDDQKKLITPLIELLMPQPKQLTKTGELKSGEQMLAESIDKFNSNLPLIPNEIIKYWGNNPAFLEFNLLDASVRINALEQLITEGYKINLKLIPVITLGSNKDFLIDAVKLAKEFSTGIALRLFKSDLNQNLAMSISQFLAEAGLTESNIDLIVDLQIINDHCPKITILNDIIPNIQEWRTFTLSSGAFPKDLTDLPVNRNDIDRADWNNWITQIQSNSLKRKPSFSDYTIQHPIFKEPIQTSNPSASIRYTSDLIWVVMRGQGIRSENSKGHAQYPANAQLLMQQPEYSGADFSHGDAYIAEKGKDILTDKTGTPRTWLRAGINHHLAFVVASISKLV